ncbi:MAG: GNAT family N-acetyltransferase [Nitrososphaerota archaeon]|jgi:RimJ/RimL family protein N-acetyltransferase|uniref:GNAT family N-acetyltransferase n=1 Tax=Candidatus Bathycorpusculum sp. TaxID=2994959 RepID=UPI002835AFEB|nr:GNAT family N-acetyltransferase [Candidatus Termitimicrobium sp.]MCL2431497.1 GNAT family N-acetyltransferase [Candidatus Termitimicrobium sp.]MDR0492481.1 GNAT family N-acetyltransferase [Nitrososphaerota archaeon]
MRQNLTIEEFTIKNFKITLKTPSMDNLMSFTVLINSLVAEKAQIACTEKVTVESEHKWLTQHIKSLEQDRSISIIAEVNGEVIASSDMHIQQEGKGIVGIIVKKQFRNLGIGTHMLKVIISQANQRGIKRLKLQVLATNNPAIHTYTKLGFIETQRISKQHFRDGQYIDEIIMERIS